MIGVKESAAYNSGFSMIFFGNMPEIEGKGGDNFKIAIAF